MSKHHVILGVLNSDVGLLMLKKSLDLLLGFYLLLLSRVVGSEHDLDLVLKLLHPL